jgi:predicted ATPase
MTELSTRYHFVDSGAQAAIYRGWTRSVSGNTTEGIPWIEQGISDFRATGSLLGLPYFLALKAEALHLADRTSEALQTVDEAEAMVQITHERQHLAELNRLRGVFLASIGAEETKIEASFLEAMRIARAQKSTSLEKRVEGSYAEYRRRKASGGGEREFRLPLW